MQNRLHGSDFAKIEKMPHDVIFITGNSDLGITDEIAALAPRNIKKWYAANALTHNSIVEPIPLGLENQCFSKRDGHGIGYPDRASLKETILKNLNTNYEATEFLYCNFNVATNPVHRQKIYNIAQKSKHITIDNPILSLHDMFQKIQDHKMILCPSGNGIDTHRLWEVLYSNRVPVTININNFSIYKLYEQLPIIILDTIEDIIDYDLLYQKYLTVKNTTYNLNLLSIDYWTNRIKTDSTK